MVTGRVSPGLKTGEPIPAEDKALLPELCPLHEPVLQLKELWPQGINAPLPSVSCGRWDGVRETTLLT